MDQKLDQESIDSASAIENALSALWEKAREASLLISTLREEKKSLLQRIDDLEEELQHSKNDSIMKQTAIEQLRTELSSSNNGIPNGSLNLSLEDKKELEKKLKTVIAKLDQYLSP